MSFFVYRFLLIACVINLSFGYQHSNGGDIVKHAKFASRKHGHGNSKNEKDRIIKFGNRNNIFGINKRHFSDNGLGIDDWHIGNGLLGDRQARNGGLREWQNGNIGLRINDWHVGNGLLGDRQVADGGFGNWLNNNIGLMINDWHVGNGLLGDRHIDNGGLQINDWHIGNELFSDLYLENDRFNDGRNRNVESRINDWHVGNGLPEDWHVGNGRIRD